MNLKLVRNFSRKENLDYNIFKGFTKKIGDKTVLNVGIGNATINPNRLKIKESSVEAFERRFEFDGIVKRYNSFTKRKKFPRLCPSRLKKNNSSNFYITQDLSNQNQENQIKTILKNFSQSRELICSRENLRNKNKIYNSNSTYKKINLVNDLIRLPEPDEYSSQHIFRKLEKSFKFFKTKREMQLTPFDKIKNKMFSNSHLVSLRKKSPSREVILAIKRKQFEEQFNFFDQIQRMNSDENLYYV